jgi:hypothetical protein
MFPANQPLSLRDFASLVPTSEAMRDALEHYRKCSRRVRSTSGLPPMESLLKITR